MSGWWRSRRWWWRWWRWWWCKRMTVLTKATSAGRDTPPLKSQTIQVSTSTGQSLCLGRDEEEDVRRDEEKKNPFTSSPPHGDVCLFVCLFVWGGVRGGEDESTKTGGSFNHLSSYRHVFLFNGAGGGREDLFILRVLWTSFPRGEEEEEELWEE